MRIDNQCLNQKHAFHFFFRFLSFPCFRQVVRNSAALGAALVQRGFTLTTGGTDNHLVLWDLRPLGLTGSKMEKLLERASVRSSIITESD